VSSNSGSGSDSDSDSDDQGGAGRREVAYRLFAAEFEDSDFSYSESDEERAPNYVVTPTGARVNRLFLVGVLTEVEEAGEDILRARVVDPTGAFVVYAGQYQPEAQAFFDRADPPAFVAVTGKARTFQPDDSDVTYTSVRPENVNEVSAGTRDRWSVQTARQTLSRVATMARALDREERGDDLGRLLESQGLDAGLAAGVPLAIDHYGTTGAYLEAVRDLSVQAAEVVAGERDEVDPFSTAPDASGEADLAALATLDTSAGQGSETDVDASAVAESGTAGDSGTSTGSGVSTDSGTTDESATTATETSTAAAESGSTGGDSADATTESTTSPGETIEGASTAEESATAEAEPSTAETDAEAAGTEASTTGSGDEGDDIGDFEPGEFDLDDDEREAIEEEYGTDFQSASEVDEPGAAGIDTPEPNAGPADADTDADAEAAAVEETGTESAGAGPADDDVGGETAQPETADDAEPEADTADGDTAAEPGEDEAGTETEPADAADVDLDEAVMDAMRDNDDGSGAPEEAIVAAVTDRLAVDEDEVSEAIQEALMGGQCYEPEDGVYKPI
jgi:RPA family protein